MSEQKDIYMEAADQITKTDSVQGRSADDARSVGLRPELAAPYGHAGSAKSREDIQLKLEKLKQCRHLAEVAGSLGVAMLHYEAFVLSSSCPNGEVLMDNTEADQRLLAVIGCASESGELLDQFKKAIFHKGQRGVTFDPEREALILKEIGDVFWYFTLLLAISGIDLKTVMFSNMDKLIQRQVENLAGASNV